MSRLSAFNSPLLLGFDHFERMLDQVAKAGNDGYPPYNIEQVGENGLRIVLAVAGFSEAELKITLEENQLTIRGRQSWPYHSTSRKVSRRLSSRMWPMPWGSNASRSRTKAGSRSRTRRDEA